MKTRSKSCSSLSTCCTECTDRNRENYSSIKRGLKKAIPAAIVLWAFHRLPSKQGLTSRKVITFLKQHYKVAHDPARTGKSISKILRCAVDFGLLKKHGNRYYLTKNSAD